MTGILTSYGGLRPDAKRYIMAGRGVVVDAKGRGDFTAIQDAVDYLAGRDGGGRIWIRNGTFYENVTTGNTHDNLIIEGESWDTIIDGEGPGSDALFCQGDVTVMDLQVKTTGNAGGGGNGLRFESATWRQFATRILCLDSDVYGIQCNASNVSITDCYCWGCDGAGIAVTQAWCHVGGCHAHSNGSDGIYVNDSGDNAQLVGNVCTSNSGYGIQITANAENCTYVGNRVTSNSSGQIQDSSGTSSGAGNDTT